MISFVSLIPVIFIFMVIIFIVAQWKNNNSIVDIFWGIGFVVCTTYLYLVGLSASLKQTIILALVLFWGIRLSTYLWKRNRNKPEDWRYQNFRKAWGKYPRLGAFFQVFMLQGIFMYIILLSIQILFIKNLYIFKWYNVLGAILAFIAILYETIADQQLYNFKKNIANKGKIMQEGLWKFCRHPNYFAEIIFWWSIFFAIVDWSDLKFTMIALISPITITWLLKKVSGVPMLESKYATNVAYQNYIQNTPALLPKIY